MKNLQTWYFATGGIAALCGMAWGIQMSATHDHTLSPAHGHLNLIGFVAMSVFGAYYALTPKAATSVLAKVHYALSLIAVVIIVPGIAMAISGQGEGFAKLGSVLAILSMGMFTVIVLRHGVGSVVSVQPAE